jgi:uncharacterized protein YbbC (DUF1343 family)
MRWSSVADFATMFYARRTLGLVACTALAVCDPGARAPSVDGIGGVSRRGTPEVRAVSNPPLPGIVADAGAHDASTDASALTPLSDPRFGAIDALVTQAIAESKLPGCVVVIGRKDEVLLRRAWGQRSIEPERTPMTIDTVFDLASLTKPIATATSLVVLAERGLVDLDAPAARYIPELAARGKGTFTVRQLLTHVSGIPVETPKSDFALGRAAAMEKIYDVQVRAQPGERFLYSDIGFLLLEEIVRRVSGQDLAAFASANVFAPLGMTETGYLPQAALRARAAPTEAKDGIFLRGDVHDPRAQLLGGIAGHAGVFSTAKDLTTYAQALLHDGAGPEVLGAASRILTPHSVDSLFAPHDVPSGIRALGWDVKSSYSINRGDSLSRRAIGHGGYTGTAMWIDRDDDLFLVFLSNRVHPDGKGAVNPLIGRIATLAGLVIGPPPEPVCACDASGGGHVETGIDVLRKDNFAELKGARVGLITNASGRANDGTRTIDLLSRAPDVTLVTLFSPEHGLGADREGRIAGGKDERSGLPVVSLYGDAFAPPPETLAGIDTLVFDIQDVGTRFYTYASTMRRAMAAAAEHHLRFVVLDRPNPIGGLEVAGPMLAASPTSSFVNHHALPVRHGMTIGELAELFDADDHMGVRLHVVRARGWRRGDYFDATGLPWVNPSPNLRSVDEALLYPGVGLLEASNVSVGRGTATPFEVVGAPWADGPRLASALTAMALPGVAFAATTFTPTTSVYANEACQGVRVTVTGRAQFEPVRTGLAIASQLVRLHAKEWHASDLGKLLAHKEAVEATLRGRPLAEIEKTWSDGLAAFQAKREKYLLYPACPASPPGR